MMVRTLRFQYLNPRRPVGAPGLSARFLLKVLDGIRKLCRSGPATRRASASQIRAGGIGGSPARGVGSANEAALGGPCRFVWLHRFTFKTGALALGGALGPDTLGRTTKLALL